MRIYGTRASKAATDSFYKAVERIVDDEASDWEEYRAARAAYIDQVRLDLKVSDV